MIQVPTVTLVEISPKDFRDRVKAKHDIPKDPPQFQLDDVVSWTGFWDNLKYGVVIGVKHNVSGWAYDILEASPTDGNTHKVSVNEKSKTKDGLFDNLKLVDRKVNV